MEQINNDQTIRECSRVLGHQVENIPQLDTSKIILTAEVNPKLLRRSNIIASAASTTTGSLTIYTTPSDKDFYLTGAQIGLIKDVVCDNTTGNFGLQMTFSGAAVKILNIPILTLTAQSSQESICFSQPIKLDRNSIINLTMSFTAGVASKSASIFGYTVDKETSL